MVTAMDSRRLGLAFAIGFCFSFSAIAKEKLHPVLKDILTYKPSVVAKLNSSHDPTGGNGDGNWHGHPTEVINGEEYKVLFHDKGEGKITRLWMTSTHGHNFPRDYKEIWFVIDGKTAYKGDPVDFFAGRGPYEYPLVLGRHASSGAYTSYVPFSYSQEAKILFKGTPQYFQVNYQEGFGASSGPSYEELLDFSKNPWWFNERMTMIPAIINTNQTYTVALGPLTISQMEVRIPESGLKDLWVQVGNQSPMPIGFFFGASVTGSETENGWQSTRNSLYYNDKFEKVLATRLPIILGASDELKIINRANLKTNMHIGFLESEIDYSQKGVSFLADYRSQLAPGTESTYPVFEAQGNIKLVSFMHQLIDGKAGDRLFLEGDEMIRFDGIEYPQQIGTGTEDYYNGGWYFHGAHSNPFSGLPRFVVNNPEGGWVKANFEFDLYRHHIPDPMISRNGMRFGFEAGPVGDYTPLRSRSLALAYKFNDYKFIEKDVIEKKSIRANRTQETVLTVNSAFDGEKNLKTKKLKVIYTKKGSIEFDIKCNDSSILLVRTFDSSDANQHAKVYLGQKYQGDFFQSVATPKNARRFAQDTMWIDRNNCTNDLESKIRIEIQGNIPFNYINFEIHYFQNTKKKQKDLITLGNRIQIFDTGKFYVNDHTLIKDNDGLYHLFGIYHQEPFNPMDEKEFVHAISKTENPFVDSKSFEYAKPSIALRASVELGENHIWAPHVQKTNDGFVMNYHGGGFDNDAVQMRQAKSLDLYHWEKRAEYLFKDFCVARDPHMIKVGGLWVMYYTRCNSKNERISGVAYRTSNDLINWSRAKMALTITNSERMSNSGFSESPFIFEKNGWYYLSVTSYPISWDATFLYKSRSPFNFSDNHIAKLASHAAEWVEHEGKLYITHAGAGQSGVWASEVRGLE